MSRTFYFVGLKRSGNHALIEWIANHFEGPVPLTNNSLTWPPRTSRLTHVFHVPDKDEVWRMRERERAYGRVIECNARIVSSEDPFRRYDVEDLRLDGTNVWLLRSFWNNAASRSRMRDSHSAGWDCRFPMWWYKLADAMSLADVAVYYDWWCGSAEYRELLRDKLELDPSMTDRANELAAEVSHKGYAGNVPSAFDGRGKLGDLNSRWRISLEDDSRFRDLVESDDEWVERCRSMNMLIFGWTLDRRGNYVEDAGAGGDAERRAVEQGGVADEGVLG